MAQGFTSAIPVPLPVNRGGTGTLSFTPYTVLVGGTTTTNPIQNIASVGTAGQILTSNGAGALPTFQNVPAGTSASTNVQVLTAGTTYVPTAGTISAIFEMIGGGGGGGSTLATAAGQCAAGAGGGGGGYFKLFLSAAEIALGVTYTIGAGGATNNSGTATTLTIGGGTVWNVNGGIAGAASGASAPPLATAGGAGGGFSLGTNATLINSSQGCPGTNGIGLSAVNYNAGGNGGGGLYGQGAGKGGFSSTTFAAGSIAFGKGSGGGGSASVQGGAALNGSAGTPGVIIVTEFISI